MKNAARAFDKQTSGSLFRPVSREPAPKETPQQDNDHLPWSTLVDGAMPPMMFQLRFHDGSLNSFAYSDLREIRCKDAGRVELFLHAMSKMVITIEGRHLRELASWFSCAMIRWIKEADPRDTETPENAAEIVKITIEEIAE